MVLITPGKEVAHEAPHHRVVDCSHPHVGCPGSQARRTRKGPGGHIEPLAPDDGSLEGGAVRRLVQSLVVLVTATRQALNIHSWLLAELFFTKVGEWPGKPRSYNGPGPPEGQ